ncbi:MULTISPECIES: nitrogenase component 1 [Butyrivibrio]|uniref:Nitrogenase n=1 Tax=Butyrivibrio fibrisolvens TaxID=831 RepID=A0A317G0X8_BUTFI|nr:MULTISPECIES: nitrogenase component 1 [Butyrivibrio]PWT27625.1 nitrogenase [Butyrivibrio fibrisolvens]SEP66385.1 nitrogenase molybdenum-iron protein alpha chain [Butyrivibrio sp. TB]
MGKLDISIPEVSIREIRLGSITGYQGSAKGLVDGYGCGGLKNRDRKFQQCAGCSISKAACMVTLIQDAAVIIHGPVGCASCLHEFNFTYYVNAKSRRGIDNPTQRKIFSTNLKETDTVYGGARKLAKAIREVNERTNASAIFVLSSCASAIIGDDIESVANEAEEEIGKPVVAIYCEGFRSTVWTTGFDAGYHGIVRKLVKPPVKKDNGLINVINFWGSDVFTKWFEPFGVKPNLITPYSTVEGLSHASEASATVQICPTLGSYLGAALEQEYGVPEIRTAAPYGIIQTDRWFRELGKLLHKEDVAEQVIKEKKEQYLPKIEELRKRLKGVRAYVTAGSAHGHALLNIVGDLGMEAVGASVFHHDPTYDGGDGAADLLARRVRDYGDVPNYNVCAKQEFEFVNVLNRIRPDILLARHGGITLWAAKLGIPSLLVEDEQANMGYEGLISYGEKIVETLENTEFIENLSKHATNPYTDWWMNEQPDTFLKEAKTEVI